MSRTFCKFYRARLLRSITVETFAIYSKPFWDRHLFKPILWGWDSILLLGLGSLWLLRETMEWNVLKLPPDPLVEALFLLWIWLISESSLLRDDNFRSCNLGTLLNFLSLGLKNPMGWLSLLCLSFLEGNNLTLFLNVLWDEL